MTPEEKIIFIHELCDNIKQDLLLKVNLMPEDWDGIELRELLADKFDDARSRMFTHDKRAKRYKDYVNTCIIHNL